MDFEDEAQEEEKSFKFGEPQDDLLLDEEPDDLGPGPDEDFNFEGEPADDYGSQDSY